MVRIIISYVIPLLLPTVIYFVWSAWVRKQITANRATTAAPTSEDAPEDAPENAPENAVEGGEFTAEEVAAYEIRTPWFRLILAGVGLVVLSLLLGVFFGPKNPPESVYQPPRIENGQVVPGQYVPKEN